MTSNVPKFTSFRPKPKESSEAPKEPRKPEKPEKSERSSKEYGYGKSAPKHRDDERSNHGEKERSELFFTDRRGDFNIVRYGGLSRYEIPAYRRTGYGFVMGVPQDRKIDRDQSTEKEIVLTPVNPRRKERLLKDRHAARERNRAIRFVKQADGGFKNADRDFIALSTSAKRRYEEEGDDSDVDIDYRGIRDAPTQLPLDSDAEFDSERVDSANAEVTRRNSALIRRTREHPEELNAWLDLVEHQEAMMLIDRSASRLSGSDRRHLAEIRISTYEQALRKISQEHQFKLYAGLMSEASKSWDEARLAKKWLDVLAKFPRNVELWEQYLSFVQSNFSSFGYDDCRAAFSKCLETLQTDQSSNHTDFILFVLVRMTSMIQEAGYQELAIAIWQALLEFHILRPSIGEDSLEDELNLFEAFWESEVPRIGEAEALGWKCFSKDNEVPALRGPLPLQFPTLSDASFEQFCMRELESMDKLRYPGRTTDEAGEDDPFHTILYSDIEAVLQVVPRSTSEVLILQGFLLFCRLPPLLCQDLADGKHRLDPFLQPQYANPLHIHNEPDITTQSTVNAANCPLKRFQTSPALLFGDYFPDSGNTVELGFVRRVLTKLATHATCNESVGEYLLALESKYFSNDAFKTAKQLLKHCPTSLRLYNAYALVESHRTNSAKADQVFSAALSMQKGDHPLSVPGSLELFSNWVWETLRRNDKKEAMWRLVSPMGQILKGSLSRDENPDQTAQLRARTMFTETKHRALLGGDFPIAVVSTSLEALLAYLSGGGKLESALMVHSKLSSWFNERGMSRTSAAELHAQSIARFLTYHTENTPIVKPSLLREALEPHIAQFPNNTILLSLYAANEARFSIDDRVRGIMQQRVLSDAKDRSIVGWTFAIHYEKLKGELAGSTSHSIRALFTKAEEDVGAHCPALWTQHVLFELDEAKKEKQKRPPSKLGRDGKRRKEEPWLEQAHKRVEETFFKGITQLPWCKNFMMLAFTHLGEEYLTEEDLRRVYNTMVEKELRLYVDSEELLA